jgi:hypothetical protein
MVLVENGNDSRIKFNVKIILAEDIERMKIFCRGGTSEQFIRLMLSIQ